MSCWDGGNSFTNFNCDGEGQAGDPDEDGGGGPRWWCIEDLGEGLPGVIEEVAWGGVGFNEDFGEELLVGFIDEMGEELIDVIEDVVGRGVGFNDDDNEGERPDEFMDEVCGGEGGG